MKLNLKPLVIAALVICTLSMNAEAKTSGQLKDGILTLELQTLGPTVSGTTETNGIVQQYGGFEKLMYEEIVGKREEEDSYGNRRVVSIKEMKEVPVFYLLHGTAVNYNGHKIENTYHNTPPWMTNGEFNYDKTAWYISAGYFRDVPTGYIVTAYPTQSNYVTGNLISLPNIQGVHAVTLNTFNGNILSQEISTTTRKSYQGVDPIFIKPTSHGTLQTKYNQFKRGQSSAVKFKYGDAHYSLHNSYGSLYGAYLTYNPVEVVAYYSPASDGGTQNISQREFESLQRVVDEGFPFKTNMLKHVKKYPVGYFSWYIRDPKDNSAIYDTDYKVTHYTTGTGEAQVYADYRTTNVSFEHVDWTVSQNYTEVSLINCVTSSTWTATVPVEINGGQYTGSPALNSKQFIINKGTVTDVNGRASTFMIGPDSEISSTVKDGTTTITTVKLSNPPVIIDWEDFPGIDLSVDLSAPVIEVIRTPGDSRTPTDKVTLQITATDPSGLKDKETGEEIREAYISINGGKFTQVFENQYIQYDVTENQTVSITARDANGNVRDYNVVISNIDEVPPEVKGFEQSTDNWTKGNVRVYVNAVDDVKLDPAGAYRYTFTPTDGGTPITTDWTKDRFYTTDRNGSLVVEVRDAVGKTTTSDPWMVSNIDIIPPDFTVDLTPDASIKASQKDGVLLTVNAINTADPVTQEASPLANLAVKWDPAEPWSSDFERMVYENGVYNIQVRDSVGNISQVKPVTVSNISDQKPKITSFVGDNLAAQFVPGPVVLTVTAESSDGTPLPDRPYSWDGGKTWTSQNTMSVSYNGEYEVTVRDSVGNTVSAFCLVKNIDATKPTANVYLYKGQPSDWTGPDPATPDDYVWKIRVDTDDIGSGVAMVKTLWNNGAYTTNTTGLTFDVVEAGVFGVLVYDKAGNETYAEKTVTWESIGESAGGSNNNAYVGITAPSTGTAGSPFEDGTSIGDVVYGPEGAYNTKTDEFKPYTPGQEGIVVDLIANSKTNKWISGYATFEGVNYPIKFKDAAGNYVEGPVKGGKNMPCRVYIPISGITKDVKNGRLVTVFQEWNDAAGTDLNREGSETLYTSVQVNPPYIQWSYDKTTGELTISPNSPVAGIASDGVKYDIDGGGDTVYTGPFVVPDGAGKITITAVDKAGNETKIELDVAKLPVSGAGGGNLPTEGADGATGAGGGAVNSFYMAGRTSESYIIGGTRNNTNSIPSGDVFSSIVGSGGGTP